MGGFSTILSQNPHSFIIRSPEEGLFLGSAVKGPFQIVIQLARSLPGCPQSV